MNTPTLALASIPAIAAFFLPTPVQVILILCLVVLVLLDLITGCIKSRKKGKAITSNGFGHTVTKLISYFALTILTFVIGFMVKEILLAGAIADSLVAMVLAFCNLREGYSIIENLKALKVIKIPKFLSRLMENIDETIDKEE